MRLISIVLLVVMAGCGDARTQGHLKSSDEIQAATNAFTPGTTTIGDVYTALGLWNRVEKTGDNESVVYWTSGGGEIWVNFDLICDGAIPNCQTDGDPNTNARDRFRDISIH